MKSMMTSLRLAPLSMEIKLKSAGEEITQLTPSTDSTTLGLKRRSLLLYQLLQRLPVLQIRMIPVLPA